MFAPTAAAPHPDGFGGARGASILEAYSEGWKPGMRVPATVHVQVVLRTSGLVKRSGIKRPRTGHFYNIAVRHDAHFNRLQLA